MTIPRHLLRLCLEDKIGHSSCFDLQRQFGLECEVSPLLTVLKIVLPILSLMKCWMVTTANSLIQRSRAIAYASDHGQNAPLEKPHLPRKAHPSTPTRMDSTKVQVVKPSGGMGTLDTSDEMTVKQVLREVADGGWVVLKGCTRATAGCAKKDIVHHKVRPL